MLCACAHYLCTTIATSHLAPPSHLQNYKGWADAVAEEARRCQWSESAVLAKLARPAEFAAAYNLVVAGIEPDHPSAAQLAGCPDRTCPICLTEVEGVPEGSTAASMGDDAPVLLSCGHVQHLGCCRETVTRASEAIPSMRVAASVLDHAAWPPRCNKSCTVAGSLLPTACRGFAPTALAASIVHPGPNQGEERRIFGQRISNLSALSGPFVRCRGSGGAGAGHGGAGGGGGTTCRLFLRLPANRTSSRAAVLYCACGLKTCSGRGGVNHCTGRPHGRVPCDEAARLKRLLANCLPALDSALASTPARAEARKRDNIRAAEETAKAEMLAAAGAAVPGAKALCETVLQHYDCQSGVRPRCVPRRTVASCLYTQRCAALSCMSLHR